MSADDGSVPADALKTCHDPGALDMLLDGLAEHYAPKVCQNVLLGAIERLLQSQGDNARFIFAHPVVLDAFVGWLTAPRTRDEMGAFMRAFHCTCNLAALDPIHRQLHSLARRKCPSGSDRTPLDDVLTKLSSPLTSLIRVANPTTFKLYKMDPNTRPLKKQDGRVRWPRTLRQVLPHGPEDSVRGLCCWLTPVLSREAVINLLGYVGWLLGVAPAETLPWFVTSRALVQGLVNILVREHRFWRMVHTRREHDRSVLLLESVGYTFNAVLRRASPCDSAELLRAGPTELFDACVRALTLCQNFVEAYPDQMDVIAVKLDEPELAYRYVAAISYNAVSEETRARLLHTPHGSIVLLEAVVKRAATLRSDEAEPWLRLTGIVNDFHRRPRCQSPRCKITFALAGEGRPFRRCACCRMVAYCSRDCQKTAWTDRHLAHKEVCRPFRDISTRYNIPRRIIAELQDPGDKKSEAVVRAINSHFNALWKFQLSTYRSEAGWERARNEDVDRQA